MSKMSMKSTIAAICLLVASATTGSAANLTVVDGELQGASGVDVGGVLFDVSFLDGTCISVFDGCDDVSDFTFQSQADAALAGQALLDQVFVDGAQGNFDSQPELTRGIEDQQPASIKRKKKRKWGPAASEHRHSFWFG